MQIEEFQRKALEIEAQKHVVIIEAYGYSLTGFVDAIEAFANACKEVAKTLYEYFETDINFFNDYSDSLEDYLGKESKRDLYKLDFTRPIIRHQVSNRKPRHLIKKIIH